MKKVTRESKEAKEAAKKASRAKLRIENKGETVDESKGRISDRSSKEGRGNQSSGDDSGSVLKSQTRLKTALTNDNIIRMVQDGDEYKVGLCDLHHDKLIAKLKLQGIDHLISRDEESLKRKLGMKGIDPLYYASDALIRLSISAIGTEGVVQHHCPVCALNRFDYIAQIAALMKKACVRKTQ
jgi:hypothetical protein